MKVAYSFQDISRWTWSTQIMNLLSQYYLIEIGWLILQLETCGEVRRARGEMGKRLGKHVQKGMCDACDA